MYSYIQNYWAPQDLQGVALTQSLGSAGNLNLNGTYSVPTNTSINFFAIGFIPTVSLTSVNNLSATSFTIVGIQNGAVISETIAGPNNNTVVTTNTYDIVNTVSSTTAVTSVSVGTGLNGYFPFYNIPTAGSSTFSLSSTFSPYALSFTTTSSDGVTYEIYQSLNNLGANGQSYTSLIDNNYLTPKGSPYVDISQIIQFTDVCNNVLVKITATDETSTMYTQFLQL